MGVTVSRRKLAAYVVAQLVAGNTRVISELAAYLIDTKKMRELPLIARDIEYAFIQKGVVVTDVYSAHTLTTSLQTAVRQYVRSQYDADEVVLRTKTDPGLLGGVIIQTPDGEKNTTIRHKITNLKAMKL